MNAPDPDWSQLRSATYRIEQTLRYDYAAPIADLRHRLVIVPRAAHGDQRRLNHRLTVSPLASTVVEHDAFGNDVALVAVDRVPDQLVFTLSSAVRRTVGDHVIVAEHARSPIYQRERRLLRPDDLMPDAARDLCALHPNAHERAEAVVRFVHAHLAYTKGITDCFTTAAMAFRMGRGVCQDYAHVTIALARLCGLTARYVSGHMVGESATHAWVEFLLPLDDDRALVVSYDPTHGGRTSLRYVTVAVGCDYDDVAPTSGVFTGRCAGTLEARQHVQLEDAA